MKSHLKSLVFLVIMLSLFMISGSVRASVTIVEDFGGKGAFSDVDNKQSGFENPGWALLGGGSFDSTGSLYRVIHTPSSGKVGLQRHIGDSEFSMEWDVANIIASGNGDLLALGVIFVPVTRIKFYMDFSKTNSSDYVFNFYYDYGYGKIYLGSADETNYTHSLEADRHIELTSTAPQADYDYFKCTSI